MRFPLTIVIFSAATLVGAILNPRQSNICPEATQYGGVAVSPSTVSPGDVNVILHPPPAYLTEIPAVECQCQFHLCDQYVRSSPRVYRLLHPSPAQQQ